MPLEITLRAFADATDDTEAREIVNAILRCLWPCELLSTKVGRYWKIHNWHEIVLKLRARDANLTPDAVVERLSAALGTVWTLKHVDQDSDAIWRREDGGSFVDSRVTWANLQCFVVES